MPPGGIRVSEASAQYVRNGHPWVTKDRDTGDVSSLEPGAVRDLYSPDGMFLARALIDPDARIVARVLSQDRKFNSSPDAFRARALAAQDFRKGLEAVATAYRVIHGEADGFPGVFIDRYGDLLIAQLVTPAAESLAILAIEALAEVLDSQGAFLKILPRNRQKGSEDVPGRWVFGVSPPETMVISEYGMKLRTWPARGFSTGVFLDHRETRRIVSGLAPGRKVLNTFAYTGAFSVACAMKGAKVDTLDLSQKTLNLARDNFYLNNLDPEAQRFIAEDALEYLACSPDAYGMVILDPPTFSTSHDTTWSPSRLTELNALALRALQPGGILVSCSNFAGLDELELLKCLTGAAAQARRSLRILSLVQPGIDFPWMPTFPESRHLKGVIARVGVY